MSFSRLRLKLFSRLRVKINALSASLTDPRARECTYDELRRAFSTACAYLRQGPHMEREIIASAHRALEKTPPDSLTPAHLAALELCVQHLHAPSMRHIDPLPDPQSELERAFSSQSA